MDHLISCNVIESGTDFQSGTKIERGTSFESGKDHVQAASGACLGKTTKEQFPEKKDEATEMTGPLSAYSFSADGGSRGFNLTYRC
jgi:hypothetical protein